MAVRRLSWDQVWGRRLARHFLTEPAPAQKLVEVAGAVGGIHAQLLATAELSVGLRVAGATGARLRAELWERRTLVKTYGPRGTVHLFPAAELPLWLAALRANPQPRQHQPASQQLPPDRTAAVLAAIAEALDGRLLTRDELGDEVAARVGGWALAPGPQAFGGNPAAWTAAIAPAARAGLLCFGPNRGNRVTFARADQWLPADPTAGPPVPGEQALAEVLRRFLAAYGPATHREFARWFHTDEAAAAALLRSLGGEVEPVDVDGWRGWLPATDPPAPPAAGTVALLPHFDCYVVGAHPRERFLHPEWARRGLTRGTAATLPVLLVDGVLGGLWQRRRRGRAVEITVDPFGPLTAAQRAAVADRADRVGEILGLAATVHFGRTEARPHL